MQPHALTCRHINQPWKGRNIVVENVLTHVSVGFFTVPTATFRILFS